MYHFTTRSKEIRSDYSITTDALDRRLTLRLDANSAKCLEVAYGVARGSGLYPFKDRASLLSYLLHDFYREVVERDNPRRPAPPVIFGKRLEV